MPKRMSKRIPYILPDCMSENLSEWCARVRVGMRWSLETVFKECVEDWSFRGLSKAQAKRDASSAARTDGLRKGEPCFGLEPAGLNWTGPIYALDIFGCFHRYAKDSQRLKHTRAIRILINLDKTHKLPKSPPGPFLETFPFLHNGCDACGFESLTGRVLTVLSIFFLLLHSEMPRYIILHHTLSWIGLLSHLKNTININHIYLFMQTYTGILCYMLRSQGCCTSLRIATLAGADAWSKNKFAVGSATKWFCAKQEINP